MIKSYILFCVIVVMGFIICLFLSLVLFTGEPSWSRRGPAELVFGENGEIVNIDDILKFSGWVEKLDGNGKVTAVYGDKLTETMSYTDNELIGLTAADQDHAYHVFWQEHGGYRYLIFFPRTAFDVVYSINAAVIFETSLGKGSTAGFFAILILDIVCLSFYLSKRVKKPLNDMIAEMREIGKRDSLSSFVPKPVGSSEDREFAEIRQVFYGMVDSLREQQEENEVLRRNRDKMLLDLSHDIRTPVASIKSAALALKEGMVEPAELSKYYGIIAGKADRVNALSDDLFTMLKLESADYRVELRRTDLAELARQVCAGQYADLVEAGYDFQIDIPEKEVWVDGDEGLLIRVMENLLGNAGKYNQTGFLIRVSLKAEGGGLRLAVEDDGERIPEEISRNMFRAFVRGESARSTQGGTGLGLSIAAAVMDKHGGELRYEHEEGRNIFCCIFQAAM